MIKIDFEFETEYGVFRDALCLSDDTYTQAEIEVMKQQRVDNWIAVVSAPSTDTGNIIEISGETYIRLDGAPPSGATLIDISGIWYFKVENNG